MNINDFHDRYGLILEGSKRLYIENLAERDYALEGTTPKRFEIDGLVFEETSWGELVRSLVFYLFDKFPEKKETAFDFTTTWSKQKIITPEKQTNAKMIDKNIWVNCNHTALHSCWLIQDFLAFFNYNPTNVVLIINRPPAIEPNEVCIFFRRKTINDFSMYLANVHNKNEDSITKIVANVQKYLNPILGTLSKNYNDFFLFDNHAYAYSYAHKVREKINKDGLYNEKARAALSRYLTYLVDFYKSVL